MLRTVRVDVEAAAADAGCVSSTLMLPLVRVRARVRVRVCVVDAHVATADERCWRRCHVNEEVWRGVKGVWRRCEGRVTRCWVEAVLLTCCCCFCAHPFYTYLAAWTSARGHCWWARGF